MAALNSAISACILARNEARRIEDALRSLKDWTDEILVIDNESEDETVAVARRYTDRVLTAPRAANFDAARNLAVAHAAGGWIFYLDADERVPPALGAALRELVRERGAEFEALLIPFKHFFCGKWMEHSGWSPGYTRPQLLKKGHFRYNERLHSGVEVDGRVLRFPADNPDLAILHYSYDDLHHYLEKLNRYTDGEAQNLLADGASHTWQAQLAHFVLDWQLYYERGRADLDGMHGFILAFMSAFYRFASRAKLWDLRRQAAPGSSDGIHRDGQDGQDGAGPAINPDPVHAAHPAHPVNAAVAPPSAVTPPSNAPEEPVPANLSEMLEFMAHVAQHGPGQWLVAHPAPTPVPPPVLLRDPSVPPCLRGTSEIPLPLLWRGPIFGASGFADEARQFVLGLIEAGEPVAIAPEDWRDGDPGLPPAVRALLEERVVPGDTPAEVCVHHSLLTLLRPSPNARFNIARALFETDRLPEGAAERLNRMDRVWVPSEFNQETFLRSGVEPEKLAVIPEALDPAPFAVPGLEPWPLPGDEAFRFLAVFDWTLHKGWDVLLEAFALEFGFDPHVGLVLKVWSSSGYTLDDIRAQADAFLRTRLGDQWTIAAPLPSQSKIQNPKSKIPNVHFWQETVPVSELPRVYRAASAFVLPTRGEGWCRPMMEAMASGLPTIATAWSGLTAYHDAGVGYPLPYRLMPVSPAGAREIPLYDGHCWAEPDVEALRRLMRQLVENPAAAAATGRAARDTVARHYSRAAVTALLREELALCRAQAKCAPATPRPGGELTGMDGMDRIGTTVSAPPSVLVAQQDGPRPGANSPRPTPASPPHPVHPVHPCEFLTRTPAGVTRRPSPAHAPPASIDFRDRLGRALRVRWEGNQSLLSSLALANRRLCLGLLAAGDVELSLAEGFNPWRDLDLARDPGLAALAALVDQPLSGPPDVTVRHHFPPDWRRPATGKLAVMQPWEYGHLPCEWVAGAAAADEVWAYSRFVRDVYVRSSVPAEKVRVVPLGFAPELFQPQGPRFALPTRKSLRFLFVGGALDRKGADLLLEAYRRAFGPGDDVCLVVKDMGTRTFYQAQTFAEPIRAAQHDPSGPEVVYLDMDLTDRQLASLYRACHCLVLPYRGEGFALTPLEAMACGLPAIVTAGGPTDDYLDETTAIRLPSRRLASGRRNIGPFECVDDPWQLEPDVDALIAALRWVRDHPDEARRRGQIAQAHVHAGWTWHHAVAGVRDRLLSLVAPPAVHPVVPSKPWPAPNTGDILETPSGETTNGHHPPIQNPKSKIQNSPGLSFCMIARDEEPRIESCLRSVAPFVDEMIVVDTGSADRTREIAARCGARVFEFPWVDCFAAARNESLRHARGDWIFWMDADDVLPPESGEKLRALVRRHPRRDAAYQAQVRIPAAPGEFSESLVDHVKLFPNRPDLRFEHRIHEQILPAIRRAGLEVLFSEIYVVHQHYDRSPGGQERKRQRDFRLLELDLRDRPDHPFVLFNLGMTHLYATQEYEVAAHYLRRSLDRSHWRDSIVRKDYAMIVTARIGQQDWPAAVAANEEGRAYYPEDAELLFQAGLIYQELGRFDDARRVLERLIEGEEDPHYRSVDAGLRTYRGRHELALLFRRMGSFVHSAEVLGDIAQGAPHYLPAQLDLVESLCLAGNRAEAADRWAAIPPLPELAAPLARLRGLLNGAHPDLEPPRPVFGRGGRG